MANQRNIVAVKIAGGLVQSVIASNRDIDIVIIDYDIDGTNDQPVDVPEPNGVKEQALAWREVPYVNAKYAARLQRCAAVGYQNRVLQHSKKSA